MSIARSLLAVALAVGAAAVLNGQTTPGSLDWPHELVKPLGIDLQDPTFWSRGLQILDDMVSEAESLAGE